MRRSLIIFAKNPEKGKVKTRLANDIGKSEALSWYLKLLKRTEMVVSGLTVEKFVFWSKAKPMHPVAFYNPEFKKDVQEGESLGDRMKNAIHKQFRKGYGAVAIIGTDCWDLKPSIIESAFDQLKTNDVVIGPAKDGGYYLLAVSSYYEELFKDIPWSTSEVATKTYAVCDKLGLKYAQLKTLSDIDRAIDLPMV